MARSQGSSGGVLLQMPQLPQTKASARRLITDQEKKFEEQACTAHQVANRIGN
jgi:hypothetical protein